MTDAELEAEAAGNVHTLLLLHMSRISTGQAELKEEFNGLRSDVKGDVNRIYDRIHSHEDKYHKPPSLPRIPTVGQACVRWLGVVSAAGGAGVVLVASLFWLHKAFEAGWFKW